MRSRASSPPEAGETSRRAADTASSAAVVPDQRGQLAAIVPAAMLDGLVALGADLRILARLHTTHDALWGLEDRARSREVDAETIATVKRAIDRSNGQRHRLIDALDASVVAAAAPGEDARAYSETPGELLDRLVILSLKRANAWRLARCAALPRERRAACRDKAARMERWVAHLLGCLGQMLADLQAGRAALPPRAEFKMYNDPLLNDVTRAELQRTGPGGSGRRQR